MFEFDAECLNSIASDTVREIILLGSMILIFTDNAQQPIRALLYDEKYILLENLQGSSSDYLVDYNKYNLIGSGEYEGVQIVMSLLF